MDKITLPFSSGTKVYVNFLTVNVSFKGHNTCDFKLILTHGIRGRVLW